MTKRNIAALLLLFVFTLTACGAPTTEVTATPVPTVEVTPAATPSPTPTPEPTPTPDPIAEQITVMTDGELAGQLLVAGIEGTVPGEDTRTAIESLHVGGVVLFGRNIESADQLTALNAELKALNEEAGNVPLFLCVDEEGGNVSRLAALDGYLKTPYDHIAAMGDPAGYGEALAERCARYGFNLDFAPVLDIWSNPDNTVIAKRAYGSDAETASLAVDTAGAMAGEGVIPVGKHFPGHGDTLTDSHSGLPVVTKTLDELEELELVPFRAAIEADIPALMVAHILMTELDPDRPASLSSAVVDGLLRADLGFDGVVFTDDLTMGAITGQYGIGEAAVMAVQAGCDVVLVCHGEDNVKAAYDALVLAMANGDLPRSRVEESVYRILSLKAAYGITS